MTVLSVYVKFKMCYPDNRTKSEAKVSLKTTVTNSQWKFRNRDTTNYMRQVIWNRASCKKMPANSKRNIVWITISSQLLLTNSVHYLSVQQAPVSASVVKQQLTSAHGVNVISYLVQTTAFSGGTVQHTDVPLFYKNILNTRISYCHNFKQTEDGTDHRLGNCKLSV